MSAQNGYLLELRQVSQMYGRGERRFTAVENVSLSLGVGEFVALLGPSGCGKSTLLRIVTGLQAPTTGQVLYRGEQVRGVNPHATIVFQTFALFPWLTVQENVEVALKARGVSPTLREQYAIGLLDRVGLDGFEGAYPRELSGGMRQKVGFARAMAVEPDLLCLDEPFSALDVLSAESLRGELLELWTGGKIPTQAILMVTHNIEEAVLLADRIVVMDKAPGRVVSEVRIELPHPRNRKSAPFQSTVDRVYATLTGQTEVESTELGSAPGEPGRTRPLPAVDVGELAGLLERLDELPDNRADIYRLAEAFGVDSSQLLSLIEAAELLGLASVAHGDIGLTPLGETFAEASILGRKAIFAARVRRVPLVRWLLSLLKASHGQRLDQGVVLAALELEFSQDQAERQLEIAIQWGRYGEVLAYDDADETFYLEQTEATVAS